MRKKSALFHLFMNVSIYKELALIGIMGIIQAFLCLVPGQKYAKFGFAYIVNKLWIVPLFLLFVLIFTIICLWDFGKNTTCGLRLNTLSTGRSARFFMNWLSKIVAFTMFYFSETVILFIIAKIYSLLPGYTGGPQGIAVDFLRSEFLIYFFPFYDPIKMLFIALIIIVLSTLCAAVAEARTNYNEKARKEA